jgi:hypothetical protein
MVTLTGSLEVGERIMRKDRRHREEVAVTRAGPEVGAGAPSSLTTLPAAQLVSRQYEDDR